MKENTGKSLIANCTACGKKQTEIGISIEVTGDSEKPLKEEFGLSKIDICYSCWFKSLGVKTLKQKWHWENNYKKSR